MSLRLLFSALLSTVLACGGDMGSSVPNGPPGGALTTSDGGATKDGGSSVETCDCSQMALPAVCMVCSDGMAVCAHFICSAGECQVRLCP